MSFLFADWQAVTVAVIILGALFYTVRRALKRLRSFRASSSCATGCGKCGENETERTNPRDGLVQISRRTTRQ